MKYYCGEFSCNKRIDSKWIEQIEYNNSLLGQVKKWETGNLFLIEFERKSQAKTELDHSNCSIYIDGYILFNDKSYSNNSNINELRELKEYLLYRICNNTSIFNEFGGSFVIIIPQNENLYVISDSISSKQFYYSSINDSICFSNDLRLLLQNTNIKFAVNKDKCFLFCSSMYATQESDVGKETFFEDIYRADAGEVIIFNNKAKTVVKNYFKKYNINTIKYTDSNPYMLFREKLKLIIKSAAENTTGNLGVSLSGGIDSAVVLACLIDLGYRERTIAYHISFKETNLHQCSDYKIVEKLVTQLNIRHRIIYADDSLRFKNAREQSEHLSYINGPVVMGNELSYDMMAPLLEQDNVDILFTGDGGDYLFMGTKYCGDYLIRTHQFKKAKARVKRLSYGTNKKTRIALYFVHNIIPFIPILSSIAYKRIFWGDNSIPSPKYIMPYVEKLAKKKNGLKKASKGKRINTWYRRFIFDFMFPKAPYVSANVDSFAFSLPLEDNTIFRTVASIPPYYHYDIFRGFQGEYRVRKMILRKAFSDILPNYIVMQQNKTNYVNMLRQMLVNDREYLQKLICNESPLRISMLGIVNDTLFKERINNILEMSLDPNFCGGDDACFYTNLIKMELWLKQVDKGRDAFLKQSEIGIFNIRNGEEK